MNYVSLLKKELRKFNNLKQEEEINSVLESTKSIKDIKKVRSVGTHWPTYLKGEKGNKKYSRKEINEMATKFYAELYSNPSNAATKNLTLENYEPELRFMEN